MKADNRELNAKEAINSFKVHIKLKLTTTYNPKGSGKNKREHQPIVNAIVKAYKGKRSLWPNFPPWALMASRMSYSSVTRYAHS
jgi:hypothetical protein